MSPFERAFCRTGAWGSLARRAVLPWALGGHRLSGDVLEIGGGAGAMAEGLVRSFPGTRLAVTDIDPRMVEAARRRLGSLPGVTVRLADATALPYADESFDQVTSFLMLHHLGDWRAAVVEAARVLRPGGLLLGYDLTPTLLARVVHRLDRSPHELVAPGDLRAAAERAGLRPLRVRVSLLAHVMRFAVEKPARPSAGRSAG